MGDKNMKMLAKKRAAKDEDAEIDVEPRWSAEMGKDDVKRVESKRAVDEFPRAIEPDAADEDLADHKMMSSRKKKYKFGLVKSMLGHMNSMDGDE